MSLSRTLSLAAEIRQDKQVGIILIPLCLIGERPPHLPERFFIPKYSFTSVILFQDSSKIKDQDDEKNSTDSEATSTSVPEIIAPTTKEKQENQDQKDWVHLMAFLYLLRFPRC